jgi:glycerol-3-phosphate dehydrogenase
MAGRTLVHVLRHRKTSSLCYGQPFPNVFSGPTSGRSFTSFSRARRRHSTSSNDSSPRDPGLAWTSVVSDPAEVPAPEGIPSRSLQIAVLQQGHTKYDVLVIGGGATGAGIALDAATRGLTVACLERGDFSSETSSRSTKLIWAGLKYMGTASSALLSPKFFQDPSLALSDFWGEMKMVWHCHVERRYMTSTQKHLCRWIPIVVPFYSWHVSPPPMGQWLYGYFPILAPFTFKFYDALSYFSCPPSYILTKVRTRQVFPQLVHDNLKYCSVFYEAQHNDARTNVAIAMTAADKGAQIVNYVEMIELLKDETGKVVGAKALDRMTGKVWDIQAKKVVFAGGPFTDALRKHEARSENHESFQPAIHGSHGIHIVLPGHFIPKDLGLLDYNTSDGRFLFILPWLNQR